MTILQAPPTSQPVTRRACALARGDGSARTAVAVPQPGERGHLQHALVSAIRTRHYSRRTEQAYWHWTRAFVLWSGRRHPLEMGAPEVGAFLSHLATEREVAASTQRQALSALLFLYREVLGIKLPWMDAIVRAKQPQRLPNVLTVAETARVLAALPDDGTGLLLRLIYGAGLRLAEGLRLRVKDVDFERRILLIRGGKGDKDRVTMLPASIVANLRAHLAERRRWHDKDLATGMADVELPHAIDRKYPNAGREWGWQYVFAAADYSTDPRTGVIRRHHIHEKTIQRHVKDAARRAGIDKPAHPHTLRHSFATHLLAGGCDLHEAQHLGRSVEAAPVLLHRHVVQGGDRVGAQRLRVVHLLGGLARRGGRVRASLWFFLAGSMPLPPRHHVLRMGDGGVHQHRVAAQFHGDGGVGGGADAGVEDYRDLCALGDDRDVVRVADAGAGAARPAQL